jgi:hypothetical protein
MSKQTEKQLGMAVGCLAIITHISAIVGIIAIIVMVIKYIME